MKIRCGSCKAVLEVSDALAGKRRKCPKCDAVIEAPLPSSRSAESSGPPATAEQKGYARSLGIDFPPDVTKKEMTALISKGIDERDSDRRRQVDELAARESRAYEETRAAILAETDEEDCRLSKATLHQMLEELENRDKGAILISLDIDDVTGAEFRVSFSDSLSEAKMRAVLLALGSLVARQASG